MHLQRERERLSARSEVIKAFALKNFDDCRVLKFALDVEEVISFTYAFSLLLRRERSFFGFVKHDLHSVQSFCFSFLLVNIITYNYYEASTAYEAENSGAF